MEEKLKKMYNALQAFRTDVVKARCMADSPVESWRYTEIIDEADELLCLLKNEITN